MSKKKKKASKKKEDPKVFVSDPFEMKDLEIQAAQQTDEALDLDEELEDLEAELTDEEITENVAASDEQLDRLEQRMQEEHEKNVAELEEALSEEDSQKELAAQIAEDEAIEAENQKNEKESRRDDPEIQAALPKVDADGNLDVVELQSCIETILFLSEKPVTLKKLKELIGPDFPAKTYKKALAELKTRYEESVHHGIHLCEIAGGYQFRTKPGRAALGRLLSKVAAHRLSRGAMECLAIVAYRQPVMKEDIDKVRGVDSSHFIRGLLEKKLIKISGRSELPGRPMLYSTNENFLEVFGLNSLEDLPPLRELEQMVPASEAALEEDPRIKEMRRLVSDMKSAKEANDYDPKEDDQFLRDIRERVKSISATTQYLDDQVELEKREKEIKKLVSKGLIPEVAEELPEEILADKAAQQALAAEADEQIEVTIEDAPTTEPEPQLAEAAPADEATQDPEQIAADMVAESAQGDSPAEPTDAEPN